VINKFVQLMLLEYLIKLFGYLIELFGYLNLFIVLLRCLVNLKLFD